MNCCWVSLPSCCCVAAEIRFTFLLLWHVFYLFFFCGRVTRGRLTRVFDSSRYDRAQQPFVSRLFFPPSSRLFSKFLQSCASPFQPSPFSHPGTTPINLAHAIGPCKSRYNKTSTCVRKGAAQLVAGADPRTAGHPSSRFFFSKTACGWLG